MPVPAPCWRPRHTPKRATKPATRSSAPEPGAAYIYLNYGMYWLTNVLTKDARTGERGFVLLRSLKPVAGLDLMRRRRGRERNRDLCSGPGKLSLALNITGEIHGADLAGSPGGRGFFSAGRPSGLVVEQDRRIGISKARELPWRFLVRDSPWVSRVRSLMAAQRRGPISRKSACRPCATALPMIAGDSAADC